ncbi:MAG: translation initiation factor IF-2 [Gemmatimonadetes bacterium]|nr:translation initiation factor IF-2 [Gemmatimonadota bacterium]
MSLLAKTTGKTTVKKKRVYEIAREFNLSSVAMVEQIRSLGFEVKNHMAICTTEMVEAVQKKFDSERQATRRKLRRKDDEKKEREIREQKPRVSRFRSVQSDKKTETGSESRQRPRRRRRRTDYPTVIVEDVSQTPVQQEPKTKAPKTKEEKPVAKEEPKAKPVQEKRSRTRPPRKRRRRRKRPVVDEREVSENVRRTLAQMSSGAAPSRVRRRRRQDSEKPEDETTDGQVLKVNEFTTIGELASQMDVRPTEVITQCLKLGMVVTINQRLDMDTITLVADEFGFGVEELEEYGEEVLAVEVEVPGDSQKPRPPVVTIMGHVDHGKTSLLDYIRETNVMEGEAGGITQHIGAYHVELGDGREICFLDTPGHEAFTAMRARGASVTDVVVLVVAADDSVMPQTVEAIDHAKAANVPLVVAINKIDLPTSDPDKIKRELTEHNVIVEDYGGSVQVCEISAKTGQNIDALLELLALETEMLELVADPDKRARGTIVESKLDRGRGNVATVLVQEGRLQVGDPFITGMFSGRVRAMLDERGISVTTAGPSRPVQVLGLAGLPQAGDTFHVVENEREARDISQKRQQLRREQEFHRVRRVSLSDIHNQIETGNMEELRLIIKGDVDGSVEALQDALLQIEHEEVHLSVIHRAVGAISESDILLASASDAIIIGFNVRPDANAREVAAQERVDIRLYRVIYEVVEDIRAALSGLLAPKIEENVQGEAQVRELFQVPSVGTIAGCLVSQGLIHRTTNARVLRDGVIVYEGRIGSLRRFKDDVREVQNGFECGIGIENFNDVKVGDVIETYELVETTRSI